MAIVWIMLINLLNPCLICSKMLTPLLVEIHAHTNTANYTTDHGNKKHNQSCRKDLCHFCNTNLKNADQNPTTSCR